MLLHCLVCSYQTGNTVSNLIMILPPICGAIQTFRNGLERRYVCSFLGLAGQVDFGLLEFSISQSIEKLILKTVDFMCALQLWVLVPGAFT